MVRFAQRAIILSQLALLGQLEVLPFGSPDRHFWVFDFDTVFRLTFLDNKLAKVLASISFVSI